MSRFGNSTDCLEPRPRWYQKSTRYQVLYPVETPPKENRTEPYRAVPCSGKAPIDYFTDVLATFLCLDRGSILAVYGGSESSQISSKMYLNLCSKDE